LKFRLGCACSVEDAALWALPPEKAVAQHQVARCNKDSPAIVRSFWQSRIYDFNVCSRKKKNKKLHYMP
jgi:hypothetical protein